MSCLDGSLTLVGSVAGSVAVASDFTARISLVGGASARVSPAYDFRASVTFMSDAWFRMYEVCDASVSGPYLEIDPEVLWLTDWGLNDVYSNTNWIVE